MSRMDIDLDLWNGPDDLELTLSELESLRSQIYELEKVRDNIESQRQELQKIIEMMEKSS